jgi:hypothetical protein
VFEQNHRASVADVRRLLGSLVFLSLVTQPGTALAACASDPTDISYKRMIRTGTTGDDYFHRMIIGRVAAVRDPGDEGGKAIAVVAVGAHPTGFVPLVARVRFDKLPSGVWVEDHIEFGVGERWVILVRGKKDGSYVHDGGCGQTQALSPYRFRQLLRLAKRT